MSCWCLLGTSDDSLVTMINTWPHTEWPCWMALYSMRGCTAVTMSLPRPQLWGGGIGLDEAVLFNAGGVTLRLGSLARLGNGHCPSSQRGRQDDCSQSRPRNRTIHRGTEQWTFKMQAEVTRSTQCSYWLAADSSLTVHNSPLESPSNFCIDWLKFMQSILRAIKWFGKTLSSQ